MDSRPIFEVDVGRGVKWKLYNFVCCTNPRVVRLGRRVPLSKSSRRIPDHWCELPKDWSWQWGRTLRGASRDGAWIFLRDRHCNKSRTIELWLQALVLVLLQLDWRTTGRWERRGPKGGATSGGAPTWIVGSRWTLTAFGRENNCCGRELGNSWKKVLCVRVAWERVGQWLGKGFVCVRKSWRRFQKIWWGRSDVGRPVGECFGEGGNWVRQGRWEWECEPFG